MESLAILTIGLIILATGVAYLMHRNNKEFEKAMEIAMGASKAGSVPPERRYERATEFDFAVINDRTLTDEEIAKTLGRSIPAIRTLRSRIKKQARLAEARLADLEANNG